MRRFRPHEAPIVERVAFAFDTAFVDARADGEVKVFRLRRRRRARRWRAIAPMRCAGATHAAAAAPGAQPAPPSEASRGGTLRRTRAGAEAVAVHAFQGNVGDAPPTASAWRRSAGARSSCGRLGEGAAVAYAAPRAGHAGAPRARVIAWSRCWRGKVVEIVDERRPGAPIFTVTARDKVARADALGRWADDLALLQPGRRPLVLPEARQPAPRTMRRHAASLASRRARKNQPEPIRAADDYRELGRSRLGPHLLAGGFGLRRKRFSAMISRAFDGAAPRPIEAVVGKPRRPSHRPRPGCCVRGQGRDRR